MTRTGRGASGADVANPGAATGPEAVNARRNGADAPRAAAAPAVAARPVEAQTSGTWVKAVAEVRQPAF
jgi:hypothetical protein